MIAEYTKKELAEISGYSYRRLYDIDLALPEGSKLFVKTESGKYDLKLFVDRWVKFNLNRESADDMEDLSLDEVRAKHEQVKTQKTELEVMRMRGELVAVEDVRKLWGDIAKNVMQSMLRLPSKIAPQLTMMENTEMISGILEEEIRDVLNAIADTPVPIGAAESVEQDEDG